MIKEPVKLDLVMGRETVFQFVWIVAGVIYLFTIGEEVAPLAPVFWWQWTLLAVMISGIFLQWFFEEYYLADLNKGIIWRCSGNRFFVDQTEFLRKEHINSFVLNIVIGNKGSISYHLGLVRNNGDLVQLSDNRGGFFKSGLLAKGQMLAKEFGCPFHCAEKMPLQIRHNEKDELVVKEQASSYMKGPPVNWLRVAGMLFVALAGIVGLFLLMVLFIK
jgi:hypothetical protein